MSHIATLVHDTLRLDLGKADRVITLYQCENGSGDCPVWDADAGANHCVVLDSEDQAPWSGGAPDGNWVYPECRVLQWVEGDDGVSDTEYPLHFDRTSAFDARAVELALDDVPKTRLGGTPDWYQRPEIGLGRWSFIAPIDHGWEIDGPPATANEIGLPVFDNVEESTTYPDASPADDDARVGAVVDSWGWYVLGPNLGFGTAYVFLDYAEDPPTAIYLAQR